MTTAEAQLTAGALAALSNGADPADTKLVVQVLERSEIANPKGPRLRLSVSDSVNRLLLMLSGDGVAAAADVKQNTIVRVPLAYSMQDINGQRVILCSSPLEIVAHATAQIGNPVPLPAKAGAATATAASASTATATASASASSSTAGPASRPTAGGFNSGARAGAAPFGSPNSKAGGTFGGGVSPSQQRNGSGGASAASASAAAQNVRPISALNPYQRNWTIKARVTSKSEIRTWNKPGSNTGKLFSVDLVDAGGGQIRATAFHNTVDKFFNVFEEKKVYLISKGTVKTANARFNKISEYEITLGDDSDVQMVEDTAEIKQQQYEFVQFKDLEQIQPDAFIDIVGVVCQVGQHGSINTKTGKSLNRRNVTLADRSNSSVELTLWGQEADNNDESKLLHQVLVVKGVRVSNYSNRSLSTSFQSKIFLNPTDTNETAENRAWYDAQGRAMFAEKSLNALTRRDGSGSGDGGGANASVRKTFSAIKDEGLGRKQLAGGQSNAKGDYFSVRGTVVYYNVNPQKPPWYVACGQQTAQGRPCQRKVTKEQHGYHCSSCNRATPGEMRFLLSVLACDHTGGYWLTAFNEQAEKLLNGTKAKDIASLVEEKREDEFKRVFTQHHFKQYVFRLRAQEDQQQNNDGTMGDHRIRCQVLAIEELNDFKKENELIIKQIEAAVGPL